MNFLHDYYVPSDCRGGSGFHADDAHVDAHDHGHDHYARDYVHHNDVRCDYAHAHAQAHDYGYDDADADDDDHYAQDDVPSPYPR